MFHPPVSADNPPRPLIGRTGRLVEARTKVRSPSQAAKAPSQWAELVVHDVEDQIGIHAEVLVDDVA